MLYICCLCKKMQIQPFLNSFLCEKCYTSLNGLSLGQGDKAWSLFNYSSLARDLVLKAKVGRQRGAALCLRHLVMSHPELGFFLKGVDFVCPAPSSLWSRFWGRYDIAYMVAEGLSEERGIPIKLLPYKSYFRLRKRSRIPSEIRRKSVTIPDLIGEETEDNNSRLPCILLVDDVMTTGHTLCTMKSALGKYEYKVLTIASAYRKEVFDGSASV